MVVTTRESITKQHRRKIIKHKSVEEHEYFVRSTVYFGYDKRNGMLNKRESDNYL